MAILEHQYIEFENILSYKTRVESSRLEKLVSYVKRNADALGLTIIGNIIFTISEIVEIPNKRILGIELLVPVDKAFESCEQYIYKPKFRLVNAVSIRFSDFNKFEEANDELERYLKQKKFTAASGIYFIINCEHECCVLPTIYDAVISVNDNIV